MMMQLQQALKLGQSVPDINNSSTSLYFSFLLILPTVLLSHMVRY